MLVVGFMQKATDKVVSDFLPRKSGSDKEKIMSLHFLKL